MIKPPNPALVNRGPFGVFRRTVLGGGPVQTQVYPPYTPTGGIVMGGTQTVAASVYGPGSGGQRRVAAAPRRRVQA